MTRIFLTLNGVTKDITDGFAPPLSNRYLQKAWRWDFEDDLEDLQIHVDFETARELILQKIRDDRKHPMAQLDIEFQRALENSDEPKKSEVVAMKQRYRDAPIHSLITNATTIDDLLAISIDTLVNTDSTSTEE